MVNVQQNGERKLFPAELATQMGAPRLFLAEGPKRGVNAPGCPLVLFQLRGFCPRWLARSAGA